MDVNMFSRMEKPIGQEDRAHGVIVCRYLLVLEASKASRGIQCNGRPWISQLRALWIRLQVSFSLLWPLRFFFVRQQRECEHRLEIVYWTMNDTFDILSLTLQGMAELHNLCTGQCNVCRQLLFRNNLYVCIRNTNLYIAYTDLIPGDDVSCCNGHMCRNCCTGREKRRSHSLQ